MPTPRLCGGSTVTSSSPKQMRPESGLLKPAIAINNVVLPDPDGPSNVRNSPALTSMLTLLRAKKSPYVLVNAVTDIDSDAAVSEVIYCSYLYQNLSYETDMWAGAHISVKRWDWSIRSIVPYTFPVISHDILHTIRDRQPAFLTHYSDVTARPLTALLALL